MSAAWKKQDRPCPPCRYCGAELYEKFWGGGGWVPSDAGTDNAHGNCIRVVAAQLATVTRERDEAHALISRAEGALSDARTVPTELLAGIAALVRERDEARANLAAAEREIERHVCPDSLALTEALAEVARWGTAAEHVVRDFDGEYAGRLAPLLDLLGEEMAP